MTFIRWFTMNIHCILLRMMSCKKLLGFRLFKTVCKYDGNEIGGFTYVLCFYLQKFKFLKY